MGYRPKKPTPYYYASSITKTIFCLGLSQIETPNIDVEKTVRTKVLVDISQSIYQSVGAYAFNTTVTIVHGYKV